jgi:hypothetical protein
MDMTAGVCVGDPACHLLGFEPEEECAVMWSFCFYFPEGAGLSPTVAALQLAPTSTAHKAFSTSSRFVIVWVFDSSHAPGCEVCIDMCICKCVYLHM